MLTVPKYFLRPHVLSICNALDVPHVSATADHAAVADSSTSQMISVHTQPPLAAVNTAVSDLVHLSNWSRVAVVYERNRAGRAIALQDRLLADGVHCLARRVVPYQVMSYYMSCFAAEHVDGSRVRRTSTTY